MICGERKSVVILHVHVVIYQIDTTCIIILKSLYTTCILQQNVVIRYHHCGSCNLEYFLQSI